MDNQRSLTRLQESPVDLILSQMRPVHTSTSCSWR